MPVVTVLDLVSRGSTYRFLIDQTSTNIVQGTVVQLLTPHDADKPMYLPADSEKMVAIDIQEAKVYFEFSYANRGDWDGRLYFKDEEYWDTELIEMTEVWQMAVPKLQDMLTSEL